MQNFQSVQSAYRKFHSCEAALLHAQNDIFVSLDAGRSTALLLLDLLAAFDTIDHSIVGRGRNIHRFNARENVKIMYSITYILAELKNN